MRKGFTLIELLAVIVILAIIALIGTPIVLNIIKDSRESSMLRSAEMYLSGVENAVMRENMNNGGNFKPSECTIANGNMTCGSTTVEVEVDGEVPSSGSVVFENGKITSVTLNYEIGTIVKDSSGSLKYSDGESENDKLEYTAYVVGDEVTVGGENFYVIADSDESQDTVKLLAEKCLDIETLLQSDNPDRILFSSKNYWSSIEGITYPYDVTDTPTSADTDAMAVARAYGTKKGGKGRLLTRDEVIDLSGGVFDYNLVSGPDWLKTDYYFLGTVSEGVNSEGGGYPWHIDPQEIFLNGVFESYVDYFSHGVRPVVEILKSKIN